MTEKAVKCPHCGSKYKAPSTKQPSDTHFHCAFCDTTFPPSSRTLEDYTTPTHSTQPVPTKRMPLEKAASKDRPKILSRAPEAEAHGQSPLLLLLPLFLSLSVLTFDACSNAPLLKALLPLTLVPQPAELVITESESAWVQTDQGYYLLLVKGTLYNRGEKPLERMTIESLLYNKSGEKILSQEALVKQARALNVLRSLPVEKIQRNPKKLKALKPQESTSFQIVLSPQDRMAKDRLIEAAFYSVRVKVAEYGLY